MNPVELIDVAREKCDPPTWYRLSKELGVKEGVLHGWRHAKGAYSDDAAYRLAELLGMTFLEVVAIREVSRETNPERRDRWLERMGKRVAMVSSISISTLALAVIASGNSVTAQANSLPSKTNDAISLYYVNSLLRRLLQWLRVFGRFPAYGS